jgi:hypothetical protein
MNARAILATLSLLSFAVLPAHADDKLPLWSGTPVTILRTDGTTETAKFHATAENPPRLLLLDTDARHWSAGVKTRELPLAEVAAIEGPVGTKFRVKHVLLSTLVGAAAGGIVGLITTPRQEIPYTQVSFGNAAPNDAGGSTAMGIVAGGLAGALVGVVTAPDTGPVRRWSFDSAGNAVIESATPR